MDYAHESVGFLTWHRLYLLWFEREMQYVLNGTPFTLRYWDWTTPGDRNAPFDNDKLGTSENGIVMGELMNDWYTVCKGVKTMDKSVCNPKLHKGNSVIRCNITEQCEPDYDGWPNSPSTKKCLMLHQFRRDTTDNDISNKYDRSSFSNYLEGFAIDDVDDEVNITDIPKSLHNQVSLIIQ